MIELKKIYKRYGNTVILDGVNCEFKPNNIYGIVGRNGSGKTVLLKMLCGLVSASSGSILIDGQPRRKNDVMLPNSGVIIEEPGFIDSYSGLTNLKLLGMLNGKISKSDIEKAMNLLQLDPCDKKPVGKYSLGMRQRLGIAQAIMENPEYLILDEPMNGLDDYNLMIVRKLFQELKNNGKTIIMATHSYDDINNLCDHVYEIKNGQMRKVK